MRSEEEHILRSVLGGEMPGVDAISTVEGRVKGGHDNNIYIVG